MSVEPKISLDCPYCNEPIYETLSWFKKDYSTCPACEQGLAAGQFSAVISNLEQAIAANIEEMVNGRSAGSCCGKKPSGNKSSCCS